MIIPVLNEERVIAATLAAVLEQEGDFEVLVVDGGSTDRTAALAAPYTDVLWLTAPAGRASQMNAGAAQAGGEWLLFLHADTRLPPGALVKLAGLTPDTATQAGGFRHRFSGNGFGLWLISRLHNFRCRVTGVFYGDQALFIRRSLFEDMGGFPAQPILEDLLFGEQLVKRTKPLLMDDYVITDSRKFEQQGVWLSLLRVLGILLRHELRLPVRRGKFFTDVR